MGFLDHTTNNIIVDAVLTDEGRAKLASASGLSIIKYAFADTEVDYTLLKKYGEVVGKEKIEKNTPIFEASTSGSVASRHTLLTDSAAANVENISITGPTEAPVGSNTTYKYIVTFKNFDPNQTLDVDIVYTFGAWIVDGNGVLSNDFLVGDPNQLLKRGTFSAGATTDANGEAVLTVVMIDSPFSAGTKYASFEIIERGGVTSSAATLTIEK